MNSFICTGLSFFQCYALPLCGGPTASASFPGIVGGSRASKDGQRRKRDFERSWKGTSTSHACSSWFYNARASPLPWPCPGSVLQVLKMWTYRSDVPCPTSEATAWSWSCCTVVSMPQFTINFCSRISCLTFSFFPYFTRFFVDLGGACFVSQFRT